MTKMPEPFGYVVDHVCDDIRFSKEKPSQPRDALAEVEVEITPVITATQAEAYANERVREALEKAANKCKNSMMANTGSWCGATANHCAESILALIPNEQS